MKVWSNTFIIFHWLLVVTLLLSFFSIEIFDEELHFLVAYTLALPLVLRFYLLVFGNPYERFTAFAVIKDLKSFIKTKKSYTGHNPMASIVMVLLLIDVIIIFLSGLFLESFLEFQGPLSFLALLGSKEITFFLKTVHQQAFHFLLFLIALHFAGLMLSYKEDGLKHIRSIFTGRKDE